MGAGGGCCLCHMKMVTLLLLPCSVQQYMYTAGVNKTFPRYPGPRPALTCPHTLPDTVHTMPHASPHLSAHVAQASQPLTIGRSYSNDISQPRTLRCPTLPHTLSHISPPFPHFPTQVAPATTRRSPSQSAAPTPTTSANPAPASPDTSEATAPPPRWGPACCSQRHLPTARFHRNL